jgi:hypothetical protein
MNRDLSSFIIDYSKTRRLLTNAALLNMEVGRIIGINNGRIMFRLRKKYNYRWYRV